MMMSNSTDNFTTVTYTSTKCFNWKDFSTYWFYTYLICSVLSILVNSMVIGLVFSCKKLRTTPNFFIVNMCVSDALVPIFFFGRYIIFIRYQAASFFICKFVPFFWRVSMAVSVQSLLVISVHRFYAVCFPVRARMKRSNSACALTVGLIWLSAIAISLPELLYRKLYYLRHGTYCYNAMEHNNWVVYHLFLLIALVAVPFGTMCVLYTAIVVILYNKKQPPGNVCAMQAEIRRKQNVKLTKFLIAVVSVFFLFCGVYWFVYVLTFSRKIIDISSCTMAVYYAVSTLPSVYSTINPVMYFMFWKSYRRGLLQTLSGCFYHFVKFKQKLKNFRSE